MEMFEHNNLEDQIAEAKKENRDLVAIIDEANGKVDYVKFLHLIPDSAVDFYVKLNYGDTTKWIRY